MTRPRPIIPGTTHLTTRRTHKGEFLLRPSSDINECIGYILAVLCDRYEIALHAIVALSNHIHHVTTDRHGNAPDFDRDLHQNITKALNTLLDESESLWSSQQTSRVSLQEAPDVIEKIAYTMANPVAAGAVEYGHRWPGLRLAWPKKEQIFKRPKFYFRGPEEGGNWPETAVLRFTRPPGHDDLSDEELATRIKCEIQQMEQHTRDIATREQIAFLGRKAVLRASRHQMPKRNHEMFALSPTVAARVRKTRIDALLRSQDWQIEYAACLKKWSAGIRDVVFPFGTWLMRILHGVSVGPAPPLGLGVKYV